MLNWHHRINLPNSPKQFGIAYYCCEKIAKDDDDDDQRRDLAIELKKLWNMKVTVVPVVIGVLGIVTKGSIKGLGA